MTQSGSRARTAALNVRWPLVLYALVRDQWAVLAADSCCSHREVVPSWIVGHPGTEQTLAIFPVVQVLLDVCCCASKWASNMVKDLCAVVGCRVGDCRNGERVERMSLGHEHEAAFGVVVSAAGLADHPYRFSGWAGTGGARMFLGIGVVDTVT